MCELAPESLSEDLLRVQFVCVGTVGIPPLQGIEWVLSASMRRTAPNRVVPRNQSFSSLVLEMKRTFCCL